MELINLCIEGLICETGQENKPEANNVIPFLDILIIRTPSHYHTTVYHKINNPTFYTNFKSFCPLSHKINTVRTLTKRLVTHCSLPIFRSLEFSNIKKQLALSQYPHHFIHKYQYNPSHMKPMLPHRNTCILPYSTQSAAISHLLKSHGMKTYFKNNKSLATILRHPITRLQRPASVQSSGGSVYSVSCNDCSTTYIGETGRSVAIRMVEHGSALPKVWSGADPVREWIRPAVGRQSKYPPTNQGRVGDTAMPSRQEKKPRGSLPKMTSGNFVHLP
ncbi:hypothetical protein LAZ67_4002936 [Cordylochernes scorpioides]|uniref:Helix-turn-helix domain-containing protein n=1 Tax=Cordylochernes scorpioides TaxID=51811 RepID=A0ABY6KGA2_9ARAC|nr:hypothetical protein LAZ67_4002936 [Cordylochernes scorpioides]